MKKIRIGLMGAGFMGKAHSHAFHSIPYMFNPKTYEIELAGICASTPESAQKGAERFGFQKAYSSFDEMLADGEITVFDNAGPDPTHYPTVMQAIRQGKHIYCVAANNPVHPLGATLYDGYVAERVLETIKQSSKEGRRLDVKV